MKDFIKITVRACEGEYTLINKKTGKERKHKFDFFSRPEELQGRIERIIELTDDNSVNDTIEQMKAVYEKGFKEFLSQYEKKYDYTGKIDFSIIKEVASTQTVKWCIENLTIEQVIKMGLNVINIMDS